MRLQSWWMVKYNLQMKFCCTVEVYKLSTDNDAKIWGGRQRDKHELRVKL